MESLAKHSQLIHEGGSVTIESIASAVSTTDERVETIISPLCESCTFTKPPRLYDVFVKDWCPPLAILSNDELTCAWRIADYLLLPSNGLVMATAQRALRRDIVPATEHSKEIQSLVDAVNVLDPDDIARGHRVPVTVGEMSMAALWGQLESIKRAHENGCPWDENTCRYAARNGHLETLKWARANGCPWDEYTCSNAASNGQLEMLKYAHENGCPWGEWTCTNAAQNGHLETLKYAHENGCSWDWHTCISAAYNGHLETLKYAHENGCPWDEDTCEYAAANGHLETLKYAKDNGCPY